MRGNGIGLCGERAGRDGQESEVWNTHESFRAKTRPVARLRPNNWQRRNSRSRAPWVQRFNTGLHGAVGRPTSSQPALTGHSVQLPTLRRGFLEADQVKSNWKQMTGKIKQQWAEP